MVSKIFNNVKLNVTHSEKYIEDGRNGILHMLVSGENIAESLGKIAQWHGNIVWTSRLTDDRNSNDETNIPTIKALKDVTTLITEHTSNHKYAGSDSDGGAATSALKLSNTEPIGSETKPVYFTSAGIPSPIIYSLNASVPADAIFTDKYVEQIPTSDDVTYELLFAETPGDSLVTGKSRKNINLTFNPKTGLLKATSFEGSGQNITNINASNITSGTLSESFLSDTGVVAGTYGPVIGSVLDYEGTFDIPDFSVDAKGRLTVAHTRTFTLPKAYTHPTTAGYRHIPAGGAAGQFLKYSADGTAVWAKITASDLPPGTGGGTVIGGDYLPLTGGTMSGDITIPYGTSLIQTQREDSNYTVAVKWYHGGLSEAKYDPHIAHHNVGDTDGATVIVPYPTETDPWNQQIGLYISKNLLKFNGTDISLNGHKHTKADITDFGSYYSSTTSRTANTVLAAPNGSAGAATFRKLVAADLPSHTHLYAKSETAGGPAYSVASVTGSVDKARNVWFSMDSDVNRLAIDDSFLYNPSTKVLDVNTVNAISYRMINITDQTIDLNSYTNENNAYGYRMYRCKTIAGSEAISNKPVANNPFVLEVIPIRYVNNTDYITKQVFHTITNITYTRICTGGSWSSWTCENDNRYLKLSGGTVTGTLVLSKTQDISGTANNSPALIVGALATGLHLELDGNEIQAKSNGTTVSQLNLNIDGGAIQMGGDTTIKKETPKLILQNTSGTAVEIDLNRTGGASWKMINTSGNFIIQNNWVDGAAGTFFNVLKLSYSTGNAVFKGTVTAPTFIGNLTGTADIAKKVKISAAADDASRYVFFNHSTNDGEVVYDADFKYNPVTNNLSVININGYKIGGIWNAIPVVGSDGVMEVGKVLDFHTNANDTDDYDVRLTATANGLELNKDKVIIAYVQNRSARLQGGGVRFNIDSASAWAMGMSYYTADGATGIGGIGMYGTANATAPTYAYIGKAYNNAWMKIEPNGTVTATTFKGSLSGNASTATKLQTARTIDGFSFDGSANINHYATCGTAAGTAAKVATINTGTFTLTTGATVYVKFTNANTVASATLNVNSTGAKPIFHNGAAISASSYIKAGGLYQFVYDGTNWIINAGVDTNSDTKVTQTATTTNANYEVLFSATANNSTLTEQARKNSNLLFNPSTGTLTTTKVKLGSATISYDSTNESLKFTFA